MNSHLVNSGAEKTIALDIFWFSLVTDSDSVTASMKVFITSAYATKYDNGYRANKTYDG
jgi:hypothetical protein